MDRSESGDFLTFRPAKVGEESEGSTFQAHI